MSDYLYRRTAGGNWYVRIQDDTHGVDKSLGTPDKATAAVLAIPYVAAHKQRLAERPRLVTLAHWVPDYPPGRQVVNGVEIFATERELLYMDGKPFRANGGYARQLQGPPAHGMMTLDKAIKIAELASGAAAQIEAPTIDYSKDDLIFESYLQHGGKDGTGVKPKNRSEARAMWGLYQTLCIDKDGRTIPLAKLKRDDGRKIVAHLEGTGNVSMTVRRKMTWLIAAVNHGINEGKLELAVNPFASISPNKKDAKQRIPLSPDDMKAVKANLGKLSTADQLLVRLVAMTGMRLGECFQFTSEEKNDGIRCVHMGTKTDSSERAIPLPTAITKKLPRIMACLFDLAPYKGDREKAAKAASKRLNTFLHSTCGIIPPKGKKKDVHSFRHRAISILENIPGGTTYARRITGHSERGAHGVYVHKSWADLLKWVDKIGM